MSFFEKQLFENASSSNTNGYLLYAGAKEYEGKLQSPCYTIKMPLTGTENYLVEGLNHEVNPGNYLLLNPEQETEARLKSETMVTGLYLGLDRQFVNEMMASLYNGDRLRSEQQVYSETGFYEDTHDLRNGHTGNLLSQLSVNWQKADQDPFFDIDEFYLSLAQAIISDQIKVKSRIDQLKFVKATTRVEIYRRVASMHEYINDCFTEAISLEELAATACLSKYHALRSYQEVYGLSPYQQVLKLRLEKAADLLGMEMKIGGIAHACGFADHRSFSRAFRKRYGCAPSAYRRQTKGIFKLQQ